jgi:hypothetical protein
MRRLVAALATAMVASLTAFLSAGVDLLVGSTLVVIVFVSICLIVRGDWGKK